MIDLITDFWNRVDLWMLAVAVVGGAVRVGTPFLFVSLGECITERAGRVNLGLEGTLVMGAMTAYSVSYETIATLPWLLAQLLPEAVQPSPEWLAILAPWFGVFAAGVVGALLGALHAVICNRPRVNAVAVGIAMMVFGLGLAAFLGKRYIQPSAPKLPAIDFGWWAESEQLRFALRINVLFLLGVVLAPLLAWALRSTRWGLTLRLAGENEEAAAAMGYSVGRIRIGATAAGGVLAGIGGSFLSLYYPGSWNEQISSGQGLMAVALVIFARWNPVNCLGASLLFGGVGSLGLALQGQSLTTAAPGYLWNAAPYILTVVIMIAFSSRARAMAGVPGVLAAGR
jgi:general nucleoside transport system permease protein